MSGTMRALKQNRVVKSTENREGSIAEEELSEVAVSEQRITRVLQQELGTCLLERKHQSWPLMRTVVITSLSV